MRKALVNTHASWWRRRWRGEIPHEHERIPEGAPPGDPFAAVDLERSLSLVVRRLPARQRAVVVLRYFEELSVEETARLLGCHPGTVKSQTAEALNTLRTHLQAVPGAWKESDSHDRRTR